MPFTTDIIPKHLKVNGQTLKINLWAVYLQRIAVALGITLGLGESQGRVMTLFAAVMGVILTDFFGLLLENSGLIARIIPWILGGLTAFALIARFKFLPENLYPFAEVVIIVLGLPFILILIDRIVSKFFFSNKTPKVQRENTEFWSTTVQVVYILVNGITSFCLAFGLNALFALIRAKVLEL